MSFVVTKHELKSWPEFFVNIVAGRRTHELRFNDRDYRIGDRMLLREYHPVACCYSGATIEVEITSITSQEVPCAVSGQGLRPNFCILSIRRVD